MLFVRQLLDEPQICLPVSDEEAIGPKALMLHTPPLFPEVTAGARIPSVLLRTDRNGRTFLLFLEWNDRANLFCHILWLILVHLDDGVRLAEESARAAGNENGADTGFLIEQAHPVRERSDGLVRFGDNSLHQLIPHHEIRRAGILIHQQRPGTALHSLHYRGCLRGAAACIVCKKRSRILVVRKMVDEQGYVITTDAASVLRPDLHSRLICHDVLPSVPGDVIIDTKLQRLQKRGLPVIAAADDQGDPSSDSHPADCPVMRKLKRDSVFVRRAERQRILQRPLGDPALSWQDSTICDEGTQGTPLQLASEARLVFRQV